MKAGLWLATHHIRGEGGGVGEGASTVLRANPLDPSRSGEHTGAGERSCAP